MKPALCIFSPDGPLFLNPVRVPRGYSGTMTEIPESQTYDRID